MDLATLIITLRKRRGISRAELARSAGLSPSGMLFIETGRTGMPRRETFEAILVSLARGSLLTDEEIGDLHEVTGLSTDMLVRMNRYAGGERDVWTPARNPLLEDLTEAVNEALTVMPAETLIDIIRTMAKGMAANPINPRGDNAGPPPRIDVVQGAGVQSDPSTRKARKARPAD